MFNLKELVRTKYKVILEIDNTKENKLWYYKIPGKYGFINVHSLRDNVLGAYTNRRLIIKRLISIEGVRIHQRGDKECRVIFEYSEETLKLIGDLLKAKVKRHLSPENKIKAIQRLMEFRSENA